MKKKGHSIRGYAGRLTYLRRGTSEERGREEFILTRNLDGSRTLRSTAWTDDSKFLRDAVSTVSKEGRPVDTLIRLQVAEQWIGTGYLRTQGDSFRVVVDREGCSIDESVTVPPCFHVMTHAVMHDGWTFWAYQAALGGRQEITVYNTSKSWDGTDGPDGQLEPLIIERLGVDETIETPAGVFQTQHYRLTSEAIGSPPCDLWVTEPDLLLVLYDWPEFDLTYRLDRLQNL